MRILFLGDVVGRTGRETVAAALPGLRAALRVDLAIVNAENASHGFGLGPDMAQALFAAGADVLTLGNHAWDRKEIIPYIAETPRLLRRAEFSARHAGRRQRGGRRWRTGARRWCCRRWGGCSWTRWIARSAPPQQELARQRLGVTVQAIVVDFHAEASSEKMAFAHSFDGQASLIVGTHTHCPSADHQVLPGGTAFQSDARHVRRLRQRDRHGEGGGDDPVLAQDAGRAAGAGRGRGDAVRRVRRDRRRDRAGAADRAAAAWAGGWRRRCRRRRAGGGAAPMGQSVRRLV